MSSNPINQHPCNTISNNVLCVGKETKRVDGHEAMTVDPTIIHAKLGYAIHALNVAHTG